MQFLILFIVAMVISSIGFQKFVWFISLGYGFSIAGIGAAMLVLFSRQLTPVTVILCILCMIYGCRLGGYLLVREKRSASYQNTMKTEIKDGSDMNFFLKVVIWACCALLYCCETAPIFFRLKNQAGTDAAAIIGTIIMALGIVLESSADLVKNRYKKDHPKRFCRRRTFFVLSRLPQTIWAKLLIWTRRIRLRRHSTSRVIAMDCGSGRMDLHCLYHVRRCQKTGASAEQKVTEMTRTISTM